MVESILTCFSQASFKVITMLQYLLESLEGDNSKTPPTFENNRQNEGATAHKHVDIFWDTLYISSPCSQSRLGLPASGCPPA